MRRLGPAWQRFWFEPEATSTLALVRIAFGLVVLVWTLTLIRDADAFFTSEGAAVGLQATRASPAPRGGCSTSSRAGWPWAWCSAR